VEPDDPDDPLPIGGLGVKGRMVETGYRADFSEEF